MDHKERRRRLARARGRQKTLEKFHARRLSGRTTPDLNDLEMAAMLHGGTTLKEVGIAAGISSERVRQRLERIGVIPSARVDVAKIIEVVRTSKVSSLTQLEKLTAIHYLTLERAIIELGLIGAVERLFRWRRREELRLKKAAVGEALRSWAVTLGRTPGANDINQRGRPREIPSLGWLQRAFGSLRAAQVAAGLVPNASGRLPRTRTGRV